MIRGRYATMNSIGKLMISGLTMGLKPLQTGTLHRLHFAITIGYSIFAP